MIELKYFALLAAIESEGSLSGAARALGYSQPAVSQQLRSLEQRLRTPVLVRARGRVHFTDAGQALLRHGRGLLRTSELAEREARTIAGLGAGSVRLGSFASAAATVLPPALADLRAQHPGLSFSLLEGETEGCLESLRSGDCDIAIVYHYVSAARGDDQALPLVDGERAITLVEEMVFVAMPQDHRLASSRWVSLGDLEPDTWIAGCPACRGNLLEACADAGFDPAIGFETDDYVALLRLVGTGLGVALVPELMLVAAPPDDRVALRPVAPMERRVTSAVVSQALLAVPGVRATVEALVRSAAAIPTGALATRPTI